MLLSAAPAAAAAPSVIVILADDLGWGDLGQNGNPAIETPHLDRLASDGASFSRFTVQPVCSPTRAELLTGRWAPRGGVTGVTAGGERLAADTPTLADAFQAAGYRTAAIGKWHNGTQAPYHPLCRGFDAFYGFTSGHWADYFGPLLDRDGELTRGRGYLPDDLTNEAIRFLQSAPDEPAFLWLAYNTPHSPMQVPDRWWDRRAGLPEPPPATNAPKENRQHTRAALAMVENLDWNVGRLLAALDQSGRDDDTIVVFLTDNGPNGHRYNAGLRGIKGATDLGGVRSPLLVRWPGRIEARRAVDTPAAAVDLAPTLAELAGVSLAEGPPLDGQSLARVLRADGPPPPERTLFAHWGGRVSARRGALILDHDGRLYDLDADIAQTRDLAAQRPAETARLRADIEAFRRDALGDHQSRPFTVGHPALPLTQLPARDATTVGGVRHSSVHKNCTYLTGWRSPDDAVVWDIDVLQPGRFEATLYYTCPPADVGATVALTFRDASVSAQVEPPHDPPLTASRRDRVPRSEGDMKRFAPLELGQIQLPEGRGKLRLQATEVAGDTVMDLRLLTLRRVD
ncbi:sulfatase-like hydrolase/transferase [Botrimarina sp.]|uniref:sulfatase-like hydrolase/transferase n=1 Tax=Botrimarina sp. TaxID=2795802 RepID=UPI0032F010FB